MKKYENYKDSGLEWLGMVPEHWEVMPIKYVLEQSNEGIKIGPFGSALTGKVSTEHPVRVYGQWNVVGKDFNAGKNFVTEETYHELSSYQISANDILISMMGTVGKCAIIPETADKGIMDSHIVKIRLDQNKVLPEYFYYIYDKDCSKVIIEQIQCNKRGSIMDGLNSSLIKNFVITLPPLSEQRTIASYLDQKVGQIDALISEKEKMVEDLKAYRSSLITETVTKGLDKEVEMKDSGVEWIGRIPSTWKSLKIGRIYSDIGSGTTPNSNNNLYYKEDGFNWLQTGDLTDGYITETSKHISQLAIDEKHMRFYPVDSIVVAMYGATIGKVGYLKIETSTNQACCVLPPSENMDAMYMFYMMQASKEILISNSIGGGQPNISQSIIKEHIIPVPPLRIQKEIALYLQNKIGKIVSILSEQEHQLSDLKSYKSSLITEAVTGKIDLRDWQTKKS